MERVAKSSDVQMDETSQQSSSETSRLVAPPAPVNSPKHLHLVSNLLAVLFIGIILYCSFANGISLFSFHPVFMSIGWLLFMSVAINSITPGDLATEWMPIRLRSTRHWVLQVAAVTLITLGFIVIVINKYKNDSAHFQSTHSKFGLAALVFMTATILGGICTLYSLKLKHIMPPLFIKLIHSFAGVVTFSLGVVAMSLALFSAWWDKNEFGDVLRYVSLISILGVMLFTVLRPTLKIYFRIQERFQ